MADLNNIEKKLDLILQKQQEMENKINKMENVINKIESDIYLDDGFEFEILCPYCNNEFVIETDEDKTEVICPECKNTIELDWTGNVDETDFGCPQDGCSSCPGCEQTSDYDEDDDM